MTEKTKIIAGMEIQEDVLKLRIEKEQLEQENNKLLDVINNQDVKIADLEKENAELTERLEDLQEQNSEMFNTIALQEQQIEKMKNCGNCKYGFCSWSSESIDKNGRRTCHAWNKEKQKYCDIGKNGKYQCWELLRR